MSLDAADAPPASPMMDGSPAPNGPVGYVRWWPNGRGPIRAFDLYDIYPDREGCYVETHAGPGLTLDAVVDHYRAIVNEVGEAYDIEFCSSDETLAVLHRPEGAKGRMVRLMPEAPHPRTLDGFGDIDTFWWEEDPAGELAAFVFVCNGGLDCIRVGYGLTLDTLLDGFCHAEPGEDEFEDTYDLMIWSRSEVVAIVHRRPGEADRVTRLDNA